MNSPAGARRRLVEAGATLLERRGDFALGVGVSVAEVARQARSSTRTVYAEFGGVAKLWEAVIDQAGVGSPAPWLEDFSAHLLVSGPQDRLAALVAFLGRWVAEPSPQGALALVAGAAGRAGGGGARAAVGRLGELLGVAAPDEWVLVEVVSAVAAVVVGEAPPVRGEVLAGRLARLGLLPGPQGGDEVAPPTERPVPADGRVFWGDEVGRVAEVESLQLAEAQVREWVEVLARRGVDALAGRPPSEVRALSAAGWAHLVGELGRGLGPGGAGERLRRVVRRAAEVPESHPTLVAVGPAAWRLVHPRSPDPLAAALGVLISELGLVPLPALAGAVMSAALSPEPVSPLRRAADALVLVEALGERRGAGMRGEGVAAVSLHLLGELVPGAPGAFASLCVAL